MNFPIHFADGFTQQGFVAAVERLHGKLRFAYRPTLAAERGILLETAAGMGCQEFDRAMTEFIASKLLAWDLVDGAGKSIPIVVDELSRFQPEALAKLFRIVGGFEASDLDPQWTAEQAHQELVDAQEATAADRWIGELREERDAKNSCGG